MDTACSQRQTQAVSFLSQSGVVEALSETTEEEKDGGVAMVAKRTSRLESLKREAARRNLYVATYSPGDGVTRYRFIRSRGGKPVSYFADNGIYTALGIGQAETWLSGYSRRR